MKCKSTDGKAALLIALCWLVYTCSYIGKLSYNANIHLIGETYGVSYAQAGLISTLFFFTYGAGQIVNGLLCKKYNLKYVVFGSLIVGGVMNLLMVSVNDFSALKYFWLINGVAMSFLWTAMIRLLSETLNKRDTDKAVVAMGTTVATGTVIVYGISALFVSILSYEWTFYVAAAILILSAFLWLFSFTPLVEPLKRERQAEETDEKQAAEAYGSDAAQGRGGLAILIGMMIIFAVSNNFIKDGVRSWTPDILASIYETPAALSILLTLLLPVFAIGGVVVSVKLQNIVKNYIGTCTVLFLLSALCTGIVIGCLQLSMTVTVVGMALVSCLMAGVNNIITSVVPLQMKRRINSGMLAGILNGFCYLGSTVSSYGLGAIADASGWKTVFFVLLGVNAAAAVLGMLIRVVERLEKKRKRL